MADDLNVIVVQVQATGMWDVSCFNAGCGPSLHGVGESLSKGKAEAIARRHRLEIARKLVGQAERAAAEPVTIPREAYDALVKVAEYVSMGRRYVDVEPYPDAIARLALGALPERNETP